MSTQILDSQIVLILNSNWLPIGWRSVRQAFIAMSPEHDREANVLALDIETGEDGKIVYANPVEMDEWMDLPVRASDLAIGSKNRPIRCPTILIARSFSKTPVKEPQLTSASIHRRDGLIDQYTGK